MLSLKTFAVIGIIIAGTVSVSAAGIALDEAEHKCSWEVTSISENGKTDFLKCSECGDTTERDHIHDFKVIKTEGKLEYLYCECGCNETNIKEHKWEVVGHDGDKELIRCSICGCNETRK